MLNLRSQKSHFMSVEQIRSQFPELSETVYGKQLVYLDNAATSQRPQSVIDKWVQMSSSLNSNLHRAVHRIAGLATDEYESTREYVRSFINASRREEIVFTSGATASLNLLASCLGESYLKEGDEILIAESEHHSDIVPWQFLVERRKISIKVIPVLDNGVLDIESLKSLLTERTKLCCVAHVSNVLGIVNPVQQICRICHDAGCAVVVDGAQGIVHCPVDVQEMGCDFYVFSGHKMYAAPFTGVLYAKGSWLDELPPYMGGGEMIDTVTWERTTYAKAPHKFEAGTQNIAGIPTLKPAIDCFKNFEDNELDQITELMREFFSTHAEYHLFGDPEDWTAKIPLFSFTVDGAHHEDLALILDKMGIAVRSGQMCAEPLMDRFGVTGMVRASFAPYNSLDEAKYFIESLEKAVMMLK